MFNVIKWVDHFVTPKNAYNLVQNQDGTVSLVPAGTVIQQGTSMSAENFNRMERGIVDAHISSRLLSIALKQSPKAGVSGEQISEAVEAALQEAKASGKFDGNDGANATINGVNALTIASGAGIKATQSGSTLTIASTYTYGTEDIEAGSASPSPNGTLHFVYE